MQAFAVRTKNNEEVVDITHSIEELVEDSQVKEGFCLVYLPHATAALIINEYEPNISRDFVEFFRGLVPNKNWQHNSVDDNAEAHLKSALLNSGKVIPIVNNRLALGTWQRILLCEFDGPRERKVMVVLK